MILTVRFAAVTVALTSLMFWQLGKRLAGTGTWVSAAENTETAVAVTE